MPGDDVTNAKPAVRRSGRWPAVRRAHLAQHPTCAACGRKDFLNVHHIVPVHVDASAELEPSNLITLCEEPEKNCHIWVGHLGLWRSWNRHVVRDAKRWLQRILLRP